MTPVKRLLHLLQLLAKAKREARVHRQLVKEKVHQVKVVKARAAKAVLEHWLAEVLERPR